MKIVGITGGIGSGKSTVCEVFKILRIPVYEADYYAKLLSETDQRIILEYKKIFGENIYQNEKLDRKKLSELIFQNKSLLKLVESIVHPIVIEHFAKWCVIHSQYKYVLKEAAILFESGSYRNVDKIITVSSPEILRMERVMKRDHCTKEQVLERMKNQWAEEERIKNAHYIVFNDHEHSIIKQVFQIHEELLRIP